MVSYFVPNVLELEFTQQPKAESKTGKNGHLQEFFFPL